MANLNILPPEKCKWDGVALGEVMLRFDPGDVPFERARTCRVWHGGGETNVAEGLASCFGLRATVLTALVDDGFGRNIAHQLREAGVDTGHILWFAPGGKGTYATDRKGTLMNGINATFAGKGVVPSKTEYYRAHTPVRQVGAADYDLDGLFGREGVLMAIALIVAPFVILWVFDRVLGIEESAGEAEAREAEGGSARTGAHPA